MVGSKENYKFGLGAEGLRESRIVFLRDCLTCKMLENVRNPAFSEILTYVCNLPCFSTNAALEIFALDLSSSDTAMPLRGTVASEQR